MINKLRIIDEVTIYSTENTWETYRDVVQVLKTKIIKGEIKPTSVNYTDKFDKEYKPYTNGNNWGSNLDEYRVRLDSELKASLRYFRINRYSSNDSYRESKFEIEFNLPKELLSLFKGCIEREFYYKCVKIREKELELIEEKRIEEIGKELLKLKL